MSNFTLCNVYLDTHSKGYSLKTILSLYIDMSWMFSVNEKEFHNDGKKMTTCKRNFPIVMKGQILPLLSRSKLYLNSHWL